MRGTKGLAASVAAAALLMATGASAQQIETVMVLPTVDSQAYQTSSFVWDGFYVGAQAAIVATKTHEINGVVGPEQLLGDIGGHAGVFAGYRMTVTDWLVLGVDVEANNVATEYLFNAANYGALKWDAAVRATLGYPVAPNVLAYGIVGYNWGRFDMSPGIGTADSAFTAGGWQLGVGADMMVTDNIMARLQATWTHFGVNNLPSGGNPAFGTSEPSDLVVRAGLGWKF
ncbi:outer membrane protein [Devosia albogilva]|uniref:Outer membrane protein n=1 Tax=Devosia albogilva TaxID=429726 RepID=A0ABW5QK64_9HYPH